MKSFIDHVATFFAGMSCMGILVSAVLLRKYKETS